MRVLKILVVVMGVMILGAIAALAAIVIGRFSHGGSRAAPGLAVPAIEIPAGSRIEAMTAETGRLILDLVLADGTRRLVVIDLASGKELNAIPIRQAP